MATASDKRREARMRFEGIRTFEMVQYITGYVEGVEKVEDLPANLQDVIFKAMERCSLRHGIPLSPVYCHVDEDIDLPKDDPMRFYIHVILSEVVGVIQPDKLN